MVPFHYTVLTKARPELAWKIFCDHRQWNNFADVYGEIRWREREPWTVGSRLQIELLRPVNTVIEHVIISCEPSRRIGWLDHALGIVIGQWVTFEPQGDVTRVHTWGDIVHSGVMVAGQKVEDVVNGFTRTWYENFRLVCDRTADVFADAGD